MRSAFAVFLRGFTLPFGATTGRRIVFDGVAGTITWFDANGDQRGTIGGGANPASIQLYTADPDEGVNATIIAEIENAGVTRQASLSLFGPQLTGAVGPQPTLRILSDSRDGTITDSIDLGAVNVSIAEKAIGRGIIAQQVETTADTLLTTSGATDFALNNVPVIMDHTYAIHLHGLVELSAAAGQWNVFLRLNGANLVRLDRLVGAEVQRPMVDATGWWTAPATLATDDFTVFATEVIVGADFQFLGTAADLERTFTITDLGII